MAFKDIQFPPKISISALGGPGFSTTIVGLDSGIENPNQNWELERATYEVSHAARMPAQWRQLLAFFRVVHGRADSFRFKDWLDYSATAAEGRFVLLTSTTFQMYKRYTFGSVTYDRKITKPISAATITGGVSPTVSYSTGVVTVSGGTPTAWSGEFDVHCRFDTDQMRTTMIDKNGDGDFIVGWQSIPIVEVKD